MSEKKMFELDINWNISVAINLSKYALNHHACNEGNPQIKQ